MIKLDKETIFSLQTPCFILDREDFERGVDEFDSALHAYFKDYAIGYSVKTNSLPTVLCMARKSGCKAEVVSENEYELAKACGYSPSEIIYNGPMKSASTFIEAIKEGAMVNIETKRELDWLETLDSGQEYHVGIRLNINISEVSPEDADGKDDNSRFGFSDHCGEFEDAVRMISRLGHVHLSGLHIHRTTHSRSVRFYRRSVEYAARIIRKYGLKLTYIDVGGGYFGIFPNKPAFTDYAVAIHDALREYGLADLQVIVEPGNALAASPFSFLTSVIDTKRVRATTFFATTDGSRNDVDPFFHKSDYLKVIYQKDENPFQPLEHHQIITGCSCLEYDRLFELKDFPRLQAGDRILYNNVGAYTMTLSPLFIRFFPRVYLKEGNSFRLARPEWEASDYIRPQKDALLL